MSLTDEITELGVDKEDALKRFLNNQQLFEKMLKKLPKQIKTLPILEYIESGDYDQATKNAHTLKGVTGNLSVTPLYKGYTEVVALLRENEPEKAAERFKEMLPDIDNIIKCIERNS